jgi:NAD(P)-dependent dehydrogenase (short-subunit alcohol dehydrogenase family)
LGFRPTCVIAGAGPGMGTAIAERFAREGFTAYMLARRPHRVATAITALLARGLNVIPLECDVRSSASLAMTVDFITRQGGACDVVIYNAFVNSSKRATLLGSDQMLADYHTNVAAALSLVRLTIAPMRRSGRGTLLFSGCGLADVPSAKKTSLSIGKAGLRALVHCLEEELKPDGIRVGMVTIDGSVPSNAAQLASIADLYWHLFANSDKDARLEVRWPQPNV